MVPPACPSPSLLWHPLCTRRARSCHTIRQSCSIAVVAIPMANHPVLVPLHPVVPWFANSADLPRHELPQRRSPAGHLVNVLKVHGDFVTSALTRLPCFLCRHIPTHATCARNTGVPLLAHPVDVLDSEKPFVSSSKSYGKSAEHLVDNVVSVPNGEKAHVNTFKAPPLYKEMGHSKHEAVFVFPPAIVHVQE